MNIFQLKYVLEVADSSSIREASTRLYVSQPAVSTAIKELENELGILIFDRTNKGISLTDEGREFVEYAKRVIGQYDILEDKYLSKSNDKERFSASTQHYNFAIKAFTNMVSRIGPEKYSFSIHETTTKRVLDDVRTMKSEVGIVSFSESNEMVIKKLLRDYQLEFTPLMIRETYVYVWKNHELADAKEISIEELKSYPCVSFDQSDDSNFYITEEAMSDYSFEKSIKTSDRATSMEIIAGLGGYAIGSGMLTGNDVILKGLKSIKLKEEDPIEIGYITRKDSTLSVYGKTYIEELNKYKEIN